MHDATVVTTRDKHPGKGNAAGDRISRQLGDRIHGDRRQGIAGAVGEAKLQFAGRGHQGHVADLVPGPAGVGGEADRLGR
jgi:hypothetical protein